MHTHLTCLVPHGAERFFHLRVQLCMRATYMIMADSAAIPHRVRAVQYDTDDLFSAMPLRRRIPAVLLGHVAAYNSFLDMDGLYTRFASTKQHGYVLSRHPMLAQMLDDASSGHVYSLAQKQHFDVLRHIETALDYHIRVAEMLSWAHRVQQARRVRALAVSIRCAPKLPIGRPLCHESFCPPDLDTRGQII